VKRLLGGEKHPSVSGFEKKLAGLPAGEQKECRDEAFSDCLYNFHEHPKNYQTFLMNLVDKQRQEWLDFLHGNTLLGHTRYRLHEQPNAIMSYEWILFIHNS
jgi:hypothetical protein